MRYGNRHKKTCPSESRRSAQQGVVLVVALLMLLILTLIGLAATRGTSLELKMAGNTQDRMVAFEAAEAALINCHNRLMQPVLPEFSWDGTDGYYKLNGTETTPAWRRTTWSGDDSIEYDGPALTDVAASPRCIIEELPPMPPPGGSLASDTASVTLMYRVTARGIGGSPNTTVLLQATYRR